MSHQLRILILIHTDLKKPDGASRIRPLAMLKAFQRTNHIVDYLIQPKSFEYFTLLLRQKKYNLCYIEPLTTPISNVQKSIIRYLKKTGCWVSFFYRDIYWQYGLGIHLYNEKTWNNLLSRYEEELHFLTNEIDMIYVPSESFKTKLNVDKIEVSPLPPAGEELNTSYNPHDRKNVIYVGGVSKRYGTDILLEAMRIVNEAENINLTLITRSHDYKYANSIIEKYTSDWLNILFVSNKDLPKNYKNARLAIHSIRTDDYNQMTLSFKLFEYASYGIPMIVTNNNEQAKLVTENNLGWVCDDNPVSLSRSILDQYYNYDKLEKTHKLSMQYIKNHATWDIRVEKVILDYQHDAY